MTDLRKAAGMALDAMLSEYSTGGKNKYSPWDVIEALRQALAQPEQKLIGWMDGEPQYVAQPEQEPVAWMLPDYGDVLSASEADGTGIYNIPLYTAPPKPEPKSISTNDHLCAMLRQVHDVLACTALPMKRKWVGLTDEDEQQCRIEAGAKYVRHKNSIRGQMTSPADEYEWHLIRAIEAKLQGKNGG